MSLRFYFNKLVFIAPLAGSLLAGSAAAQPTISAVTPTANQNSVPGATPVTVRFSQPLNAGSAAALRVFSNQRGGLRSGNSGTTSLNNDQLTFTPNYSYRAGETVRLSVTTAAQSSSGMLATPRAFQFTAAATGGNGVFTNGSNVGTGSNPYNVTLADVDNDGDLDILAPDFGGAAVSIQFNQGNGLYSGSSSVSVGSQPRSVTTADIDGDGDLDLLTANYNANSASVRFNNGSGGFGGGADLTVGSQPQSITTADVDGDGDLDFLVANGAGGTVSVRLNNGSGTFGGGSTVSVGSFPFNIATGDVDGDGDFDMLTANYGATTVSVRLNNGSGLFLTGTEVVMGSLPRWIALGDLDTDGDLDLLSANFGSANASVRFNNGSGVFGGGTELASGNGPSSVAAADIDGDQDLDMLVSNFLSNSVTIRLNNGSGTFGPSSTFLTNINPNGIATGDVDNDGDLDLLSANFGNNSLNVGFNDAITIADLVVSTPENVSGTYRNVTITGPATGGTGTATLTGALAVVGTLTVQDGGTLLTACQPLIGSGNFVLAAGGTLGICDPLGIELAGNTGAVRLTGSRSFSNDASYIYNGTLTQVTGGALPSQVRNLSTTNANAVTLTAAATVNQAVTIGAAGNLVLNGFTLTLPSGAAGTALVVNSGTGIVQGSTARMQRYIEKGNAGLGYRHFSAPVSNAAFAMLGTSSFTPELSQAAAYNSSATPGTVTPFPNIFLYDETRAGNTTSTFSPFDQGWRAPLSAGSPMVPGLGYTVNISAQTTVEFAGGLNNGTITNGNSLTRSSANGGWNLVGNPYPAPLDWSLVAAADRPNLDASMYVFESSSQYSGTYRAYVNGLGTGAPLIGAGQGFFVRVSPGQTTGSLTFRNAQRVTSYTSQVPFRRDAAEARPVVQLRLRGAAGPADALFVYAESGASAGFDPGYDATKLANPSGLNLAAVASNDAPLAIAGLAQFTATTAVALRVGVPAAGSYVLNAEQLLNLPTNLDAYLVDAQTGQQINLRQQSSYSFSVTAAQAAQAEAGRFELRFGPAAGPLAAAAARAAFDVALYPNPARGSFSVLVPRAAGATTSRADLFNSLGQLVRADIELSPAGTATTVDAADLAKGVYVLRVQVGTSSFVKRMVLE